MDDTQTITPVFAVLGWGSLIWNQEDLPIAGEWQADGPTLPLEFARESKDGRLTLVIVPEAPAVPVLWTKMTSGNLEEAIKALAKREGAAPNAIGRWPSPARRYAEEKTIAPWAAAKGLTGVIWTALQPGMKGTRGTIPNFKELSVHLASLDEKTRALALEYIIRAPPQIATPFRSSLQAVLTEGSPE